MNKIYGKLIAAILTIAIAFSLVVVSTYAWVTMSTSPVANGIQIAISGGNTILLAPDLQREVDGTVYHYPGRFEDRLNFSKSSSYGYLGSVAGLLPVSTVDGQNWVIPAYYGSADPEVRAGRKVAGEIKPVSEFAVDDRLSFANLAEMPEDVASRGAYIYTDFWVVSPGTEYTLRISAGEIGGGSFVMSLPEPEREGEGFTLVDPEDPAANCVRVGFLINQDIAPTEAMLEYSRSEDYSTRYDRLLGRYQERGQDASELYYTSGRFLVYEPNADRHSDSEIDGSYVKTRPLAWRNGSIVESDILADRLLVQLGSQWLMSEDGERRVLEQDFQDRLIGKDLTDATPEELYNSFYGSFLQNQVSHRVIPGAFVSHTGNLYTLAGNGTADLTDLGDPTDADDPEKPIRAVTAVKDGILVHLERNTPQRIRMFIWLEGQDVDCCNTIALSDFAVSITLAGSNLNEE